MQYPKFDLSFDHRAKAAYARFSRGEVATTIEAANGLLVDLDASGNLVGIEILATETLKLLRRRESKTSPALPQLNPVDVRAIERMFEMSA